MDASAIRRAQIPYLACVGLLLASLLACSSPAHAERSPERLQLTGGLLHSSGFAASAIVGGQQFKLQVDISQGALTLPSVGCSTCRLGDRRYDVSKSSTGGKPVGCLDSLCARDVCSSSLPGSCPICTSSSSCCVDRSNLNPKADNSLFGKSGDGLFCSYNLKFSDNMDANGTMYTDTVELGATKLPGVVFGGMTEETLTFETAYVDGILGLGKLVIGYPNLTPAFLDHFANITGLPDVFTMCVTAYGGALSLGAADDELADSDFQYVPMISIKESNHYYVNVESYGLVGEVKVQLPELATGVWSSATSGIAIGKATFITIMEALIENHCHIPGLCGVNSWFRSGSCVALTEETVAAMPSITFYLSGKVPIVLEPDDYLIPYKKVYGKQIRCVGFIVFELLSTRGVGILLGATIMKRHALVFDRSNQRIGLAKAVQSKCGPSNGTSAGLAAAALGGLRNISDSDILTASSPRVKPSGVAGSSISPELVQEEVCRAIDGCSGCSSNANCSFSYANGRCVSYERSGRHPYPFCSGLTCACPVVGVTGWYVGIVVGIVLALCISGCCLCVYTKRKRKQRYQSVVPYEAAEHEVETF